MTIMSPFSRLTAQFVYNLNVRATLSCGQYLFVMLHLQSLQLTSLCTFSLTLVLRLMKLSHKNKCEENRFIITVIRSLS